MNTPLAGTVRAELQCILERFDEADRGLARAQVQGRAGDAARAEAERQDAHGDYQAACSALADLWLLLCRHACEHRPNAARALLAELLEPAGVCGLVLDVLRDPANRPALLELLAPAVGDIARILMHKG